MQIMILGTVQLSHVISKFNPIGGEDMLSIFSLIIGKNDDVAEVRVWRLCVCGLCCADARRTAKKSSIVLFRSTLYTYI